MPVQIGKSQHFQKISRLRVLWVSRGREFQSWGVTTKNSLLYVFARQAWCLDGTCRKLLWIDLKDHNGGPQWWSLRYVELRQFRDIYVKTIILNCTRKATGNQDNVMCVLLAAAFYTFCSFWTAFKRNPMFIAPHYMKNPLKTKVSESAPI